MTIPVFEHNAASDFSENSASIRGVVLLSLFFLSIAHLSVKTIFPNPVFWVITAVLLVFIGTGWIAVCKDDFGFLLVMFVCIHFAFAENQGGLWSYAIFAILLAIRFLSHGPLIRWYSVPLSSHFSLFTILTHQLLGTILSPYPIISKIQAMIVAFSQILIFYFSASQKITQSNIKRLLFMWFIVACWVFVMALNQKYCWIITPSPLLPQRHISPGDMGSTPAGSFNNSELFSEYFCIVFLFSLIILLNPKELNAFRANRAPALLMVFISSCAIMMGASRAAVLLAAAGLICIAFINVVIPYASGSFSRILILSAILAIFGLVISQLGSLISLNKMKEDFNQIQYADLGFNTIFSGKSINRGGLFSSAVGNLSKKSWWIGSGYNLRENNKKTLGLSNKRIEDYHNLYLCLPFFYGWIGAAAYVSLVIGTAVRIFALYLKSRTSNHFLVPVALGFSIMWGVFILDQYKISATRNPNYFLLIWMLLGLTHAVSNSLRGTYHTKSIIAGWKDGNDTRFQNLPR